jgi:hypothetical protein
MTGYIVQSEMTFENHQLLVAASFKSEGQNFRVCEQWNSNISNLYRDVECELPIVADAESTLTVKR